MIGKIGWGLVGILAAQLYLCQEAKADYRLDVWKRSEVFLTPETAKPIATKRFIAISDCNKELLWLSDLGRVLSIKNVVITCQVADY